MLWRRPSDEILLLDGRAGRVEELDRGDRPLDGARADPVAVGEQRHVAFDAGADARDRALPELAADVEVGRVPRDPDHRALAAEIDARRPCS